MTPLWNTIARLVVWFFWQPVDRTVCRCRWVTHRGES
jgi:hypothetical protein